jgi:glycosyltransferase involved in cell wall biosynthesis
VQDAPVTESSAGAAPFVARLGRRLRGGPRALAARWRARRGGVADGPWQEVPDVDVEPSYVGAEMDWLVREMRRNQEPIGRDPDYDLVREEFDHFHFLLQSHGLQGLPSVDPIRFFVNNGAAAINSPNRDFDMRTYLSRYPDRRTDPNPYLSWLRDGRAAGEIADPAQGIQALAPVLGLDPARIVAELVATRADTTERLRTGTLGEMFAKAAEIEPMIGAAWPETTKVRQIPVAGRALARSMGAIYACQEAAGFRRARLVIVAERSAVTGRRTQVHLARAAATVLSPDDVVVVHTDEPNDLPAVTYPAGVRVVDFGAASAELPADRRLEGLFALLRSFRADAIVNVDSGACYRMLAGYGKPLIASDRVFLCFGGDNRRPYGGTDNWHDRWFYHGLTSVTGMVFHSERLRDELVERYQVDDSFLDRVHVLRTPVDPAGADDADAGTRAERPVVRWAGRADRWRHVELAFDVARRMPDVDFRFAGPLPPRRRRPDDEPPNVRVDEPGKPGDPDDPGDPVDAHLYTAFYDGAPDGLLDLVMTGVPVVSSDVGGVGEILRDGEARLVDGSDPADYERALREVLDGWEASRKAAHALRDRLAAERTEEAYARAVASIFLRADGPRDSEADR